MTSRAVVLAHAHDLGATAVAAQLSTCFGPHDVTVVRPETLGLGRWSHRLGSTSEVQTVLILPSGMAIASSAVSCLFNRLQYLPSPRFSRASPKDRNYASAELQAIVASWLSSLGSRVVNPAGPRGQARGPISRRGWLALAADCELPVARSLAATTGKMIQATLPGERIRLRESWLAGPRGPVPVEVEPDPVTGDEEETLLVAGDRVVGALADSYGTRCRAVARRSGCTLLEFRFRRLNGAFVVGEIDPFPLLAHAEAAIATAELLLETAARHERAR